MTCAGDREIRVVSWRVSMYVSWLFRVSLLSPCVSLMASLWNESRAGIRRLIIKFGHNAWREDGNILLYLTSSSFRRIQITNKNMTRHYWLGTQILSIVLVLFRSRKRTLTFGRFSILGSGAPNENMSQNHLNHLVIFLSPKDFSSVRNS